MRGWQLVVATLLLAGCGAPAEETAAPADAPAEAPTFDDPRIAAAASPPNETVGTEEGLAGEAHAHDGWNGASRIVRFEGVVRYGRVFRPVDGLVLEGTSAIEITVASPEIAYCPGSILGVEPCTPSAADPAPPDTSLHFRHAATREWQDGGSVAWDSPTSILIDDATWIDMPHSGTSLWEFYLGAPSLTIFENARVRVEIVRGDGEIPAWPGHPRFYDNDTHEREVVRASGTTKVPTLAEEILAEEYYRDAGAIPSEKLISFGTRTIIVSANVTRSGAPPGTNPGAWWIAVSNATGSWNASHREIVDGQPLRWVIPVDEAGMDSPYSAGSRWRFALEGSFYYDLAVLGYLSLSGFTPYEVEYDLVVVASDLPPEHYLPPDAEA